MYIRCDTLEVIVQLYVVGAKNTNFMCIVNKTLQFFVMTKANVSLKHPVTSWFNFSFIVTLDLNIYSTYLSYNF